MPRRKGRSRSRHSSRGPRKDGFRKASHAAIQIAELWRKGDEFWDQRAIDILRDHLDTILGLGLRARDADRISHLIAEACEKNPRLYTTLYRAIDAHLQAGYDRTGDLAHYERFTDGTKGKRRKVAKLICRESLTAFFKK